MSLMNLLKVGGALSEGKDWPGRYTMPGKKPLPDFGADRKRSGQPVAETARGVVPLAVEPALAPAPVGLGGKPSGVMPRNEGAGEIARRLAGVVASQRAVRPEQSLGAARDSSRKALTACGDALGRLAAAGVWLREWKTRFSGRMTRRNEVAGVGVPSGGTMPSVDAVRVIRNDLSDSDFVIVPKKTAPVAVAARRSLNPFTFRKPAIRSGGTPRPAAIPEGAAVGAGQP